MVLLGFTWIQQVVEFWEINFFLNVSVRKNKNFNFFDCQAKKTVKPTFSYFFLFSSFLLHLLWMYMKYKERKKERKNMVLGLK